MLVNHGADFRVQADHYGRHDGGCAPMGRVRAHALSPIRLHVTDRRFWAPLFDATSSVERCLTIYPHFPQVIHQVIHLLALYHPRVNCYRLKRRAGQRCCAFQETHRKKIMCVSLFLGHTCDPPIAQIARLEVSTYAATILVMHMDILWPLGCALLLSNRNHQIQCL